jgi:hypothetical protein
LSRDKQSSQPGRSTRCNPSISQNCESQIAKCLALDQTSDARVLSGGSSSAGHAPWAMAREQRRRRWHHHHDHLRSVPLLSVCYDVRQLVAIENSSSSPAVRRGVERHYVPAWMPRPKNGSRNAPSSGNPMIMPDEKSIGHRCRSAQRQRGCERAMTVSKWPWSGWRWDGRACLPSCCPFWTPNCLACVIHYLDHWHGKLHQIARQRKQTLMADVLPSGLAGDWFVPRETYCLLISQANKV